MTETTKPTFDLGTTIVPNLFFDRLMNRLRDTEWRMLGLIVRQTWGFHKERDWLSHRFLTRRLGRGSAAISRAISVLVRSGLIVVRNRSGRVLLSAAERRRERSGLYFSLHPALALPYLETGRIDFHDRTSKTSNNKRKRFKRNTRVVVDPQNEHTIQPSTGNHGQKEHEDARNEQPIGLEAASNVAGDQPLSNSRPASERPERGMGQSNRTRGRRFADPKIESNWHKLGDLFHQGRFEDLRDLPWEETL